MVPGRFPCFLIYGGATRYPQAELEPTDGAVFLEVWLHVFLLGLYTEFAHTSANAN